MTRESLTPDEVGAVFRSLRALMRSFGFKPNKNELAEALIGACIVNGFDTEARIVGTLSTLGLNRLHAAQTLRRLDGVGWCVNADGRYRLIDA